MFDPFMIWETPFVWSDGHKEGRVAKLPLQHVGEISVLLSPVFR